MKAEHEIETIETSVSEIGAAGGENATANAEPVASDAKTAAADIEIAAGATVADNAAETVEDPANLALSDADESVEDPAEPLEAPRFTVKTTLNAQTQYEASRALTPKYAQITVWVCIGLAALMLCVTLVQFFRTKDSSNLLMAGMLALLLLYLCYTQFSTPKKALQRWEENIRRNFGATELHLTTEFFALNLAQSIDEGDDVTVEGYSALGRMVETERLLLIQSGRRQWFFLEKSGLQSGTVEELKAFLSEHIGGK